MKKAAKLALLTFTAALAVAFLNGNLYVQARIIGTNPTGASSDVWCVGGRISANTTVSATEVCVDASGNLIPTTTNTGALGTSSLKWASAQIAGAVNALSIVPTDTSTSRLHAPVVSTTTLLTATFSGAGDIFAPQNAAGGFVGLCVSTGTGAGAVVYSSAPTSPCR